MKISSATYISSSAKLINCPKPDKPEYAFIGRSNVGKSSLINMLTGIKGLAKISSRPGKTQVINHFLVNEKWYLVDLPGYGYAKVSKEKRSVFDKMISNYLIGRENLMNVFVLVDSRLTPQKLDLEFMEDLADINMPFSIVFTKCDKVAQSQLPKHISAFKKAMLEKWEEFPVYFLTSSETKRGKEELLKFIDESNAFFGK
ncbi:MAG TPA: ribosome biogenesis GTP-binding protein YihA/YsxC [Bacteroidia bacterium]|nr:ribosome biogenesis GTP-binding protein YihA/YsxC [Bacteroidia bacterium]